MLGCKNLLHCYMSSFPHTGIALGPSWWKGFIRRSSFPPHLPSALTHISRSVLAAQGLDIMLLAAGKNKSPELEETHLVEALTANRRFTQFALHVPLINPLWFLWSDPSHGHESQLLSPNIHLFALISLFKTRGQKTAKDTVTYEQVISTVKDILEQLFHNYVNANISPEHSCKPEVE